MSKVFLKTKQDYKSFIQCEITRMGGGKRVVISKCGASVYSFVEAAGVSLQQQRLVA